MAKAKILIVDDEYLIRWSLSENLKEDGWRTVMAETGEEALEKFHSEAPDMVLLDVKLPGISGVDVLEQIRITDKAVPVMMITSGKEGACKSFGRI